MLPKFPPVFGKPAHARLFVALALAFLGRALLLGFLGVQEILLALGQALGRGLAGRQRRAVVQGGGGEGGGWGLLLLLLLLLGRMWRRARVVSVRTCSRC